MGVLPAGVHTYEHIPHVADAPEELFNTGHLWVLEKLDSPLFRFQLQSSGVIRFGNDRRVFGDRTAVPESLQFGARHVCEQLDREAVSRAVDDVEQVVFFSVATRRRDIEYNWGRLPPVVGIDIWAEKRGFLPPDAVEAIYERLGIEPVNTFERELPPRDFDHEKYAIPQSAWRDGPAAGVVIRNKTGGRAQLENPAVSERGSSDEPRSATEVIREYATKELIAQLSEECVKQGEGIGIETLYDRVFDRVVRSAHPELFGSRSADLEAFKSALSAEIQDFVEGQSWE